MKTLYFDCFSGISGDMVIGALIDAGADPNNMAEELKKLSIQGDYDLQWKKVIKNGITSTKFDVLLKNQDHHVHSHDHVTSHEEGHNHTHGQDDQNSIKSGETSHHHTHDDHTHYDHTHHDHTHDDHTHQDHFHHDETGSGRHHSHTHSHEHDHDHAHRSYKDIVRLIEEAGFSNEVKSTALTIFKKIGEAEGHIHGIPLDEVHFHEVGAVDSIIDIVGASILIHQLGVTAIKSSPIPAGSGRIKIAHGIYPVPAPATLEILKGIPIEHSEIKGEIVTPTGAAIVAVLAEEFGSIPSMKVESIGYGAGTKTFPSHPNVLRVVLGK